MPSWNPSYTLLRTRLAIWKPILELANSLCIVPICLSLNGVNCLLQTMLSAVLGLKRQLLVLPRDVIPTKEHSRRLVFIRVVTSLLSLILPTRSTIMAPSLIVAPTSLRVLGSELHPSVMINRLMFRVLRGA